MAGFGDLDTLALQAAVDLSAAQYTVVRGSAAGLCNIASNAAASSVLGILQNKPRANEAATIGFDGISKAIAGNSRELTKPKRLAFLEKYNHDGVNDRLIEWVKSQG